MKQLNTIYYLLFVLLIMGAFAAMAQNDYGITILGIVAVAFGLIFLIQLIFSFKRDIPDWTMMVELASLSILASVMALRVFHIHFQFVEIIFGGAGTALIAVYLKRIGIAYTSIHSSSTAWAWLLAGFYLSITLYILSMLSVAFLPSISEPTGMMAFGLLILSFIGALVRKTILLEGEKITVFQWVSRSKDSSLVLITLFLIFTLYMGLTKIDALPRMYSDEFPQAYFDLVNKAESGKDKPVNGKFRHEEFKEAYNRFVDRNTNPRKP